MYIYRERKRAAIAHLAVRQDVRAALVETGSGPLMESLDLMV